MADQPGERLETGLPQDWEVRMSTSKKLPYYFDTDKKVSRWEPPPGTDTDKLKLYMATYHSSALSPIPEPAGAATSSQPGAEDASGGGGGANPEKIRAAHLLVKHSGSRRPSSWKQDTITRSQDEALEEIRGYQQRIAAGEVTLGDLAVSESDCSSARKRGDLGWFGKGDMQKEFEEAAFALNPGQVSDIVVTASGLHLIQRLE